MKKTNQKTNIFLVNKKLGKQENLVEEKKTQEDCKKQNNCFDLCTQAVGMNIECNLILIIDKLMKRNEMAYPQMFQRHTLEATTISTAPWRRPVKNAAVRSSYHWLRTLKELIIASCETVDSLYTTDFDRGYPGLLPIMHFSIVNNWHRVHENESATGLGYPLAPPVGCTKSWWGCYGYWSYSLRERTDRAAHKDRLLNQSINQSLC